MSCEVLTLETAGRVTQEKKVSGQKEEHLEEEKSEFQWTESFSNSDSLDFQRKNWNSISVVNVTKQSLPGLKKYTYRWQHHESASDASSASAAAALESRVSADPRGCFDFASDPSSDSIYALDWNKE